MASAAPPMAPSPHPPPRAPAPRPRRRSSLRAPLLIVFVMALVGGGVALGPRLPGLLGSPTQAVAANPAMSQFANAVGLVPTPTPPPTRDPRLPYCDPAHPTFLYGFAALKLQVGPKMGEPLECERTVSPGGDTRQRTTTGYAYYRSGVNVPAFTNGLDHWALTVRGLVSWSGDVVDPPGPLMETPRPAE